MVVWHIHEIPLTILMCWVFFEQQIVILTVTGCAHLIDKLKLEVGGLVFFMGFCYFSMKHLSWKLAPSFPKIAKLKKPQSRKQGAIHLSHGPLQPEPCRPSPAWWVEKLLPMKRLVSYSLLLSYAQSLITKTLFESYVVHPDWGRPHLAAWITMLTIYI